MVIAAVSYIVALIVMALLPNLFTLLSLVVAPLVRRFEFLVPVWTFSFAAAGIVFAIFCFAFIAAHTSLRPAVASMFLPAILTFLNDRDRIRRARAGVSSARTLCTPDESPAWDRAREVRTETGHLYGDLVGYGIGVFMFLRGAPLF